MSHKHYTPPYPKPNKSKVNLIFRFIKGFHSWTHVLFNRSYKMKLGHVKLFKNNFYFANEPDLINKIMVRDYKNFPKHHLMHEVLEPLLGSSIFTTNGEVWQQQREVLSKAFIHTKLEVVFPTMLDTTNDMIAYINSQFQNDSNEAEINIEEVMTFVTADVIFRTILSQKLSQENAYKIFHAFNLFQKNSQRIMVCKAYKIPCGWLSKKNIQIAGEIRGILQAIIETRYNEYHSSECKSTNNTYNDILQTILDYKNENGDNLPLKEVIDHISMLFLAGHETSASALTWCFYILSNCPHFQDAIIAEYDEQIGEQDLSYKNINKLDKIEQIFKESLRLYPPVGFFLREACQPVTMRNKKVKEGSNIVVSPWLMHRNQNHWHDSHSFIPERFDKEKASEEDIKASKCAYLPFGKGSRICIGKGFAMQEATIIIARILKEFKLKNPEDKNQNIEPLGRITVRPNKSIKLTFVKAR